MISDYTWLDKQLIEPAVARVETDVTAVTERILSLEADSLLKSQQAAFRSWQLPFSLSVLGRALPKHTVSLMRCPKTQRVTVGFKQPFFQRRYRRVTMNLRRSACAGHRVCSSSSRRRVR